MNSYYKGLTSRERFQLLKDRLRDEIANREAAALLEKLDRCGSDWNGRFTCRSPACPYCRRRNILAQQKAVRAAFSGATNSEMLFASICLPACRNIADLRSAILKGQQDLDNRIVAAGLSAVKAKGFYEVDAVSEQQFWLLPPKRKAFLNEIGAVGIGQDHQTWLPGMHVILYRADYDIADIRTALATQWPVSGQIDVQPFNEVRTVEANLNRITSYCTKFSSLTALATDTRRPLLDAWPISWDIQLHSWLNGMSKRTAFEFMRFSMGFNRSASSNRCDDLTAIESLQSLDPLPFTYSFTEIPMYNNTGWSHAFR